MTEEARRRAELCFAVARRTTFAGERENAVERGIAILKGAGLDPELFDIPGRTRAAPKPPPRSRFPEDLFTRPRSPFFDGTATADDFEDVMRRFQEHMDEAARTATREEREERQRRRQRAEGDPNRSGEAMNRLRADLAVGFLWAIDVRVYPTTAAPDGSRRFVTPELSDLEYDEAGIIEVAERKGWQGQDPNAKPEPAPENVHKMNPRGKWSDEVLGRAILYLTARGLSIRSIPESDYWAVDGELWQSRTVIFAARLRGFEP